MIEGVLGLLAGPLRFADRIADIAIFLVSGFCCLLATPFVYALRLLGVIAWCIEVRIDGALVDRQFVKGRQASEMRMQEIADLLADNHFQASNEPSGRTGEPR